MNPFSTSSRNRQINKTNALRQFDLVFHSDSSKSLYRLFNRSSLKQIDRALVINITKCRHAELSSSIGLRLEKKAHWLYDVVHTNCATTSLTLSLDLTLYTLCVCRDLRYMAKYIFCLIWNSSRRKYGKSSHCNLMISHAQY